MTEHAVTRSRPRRKAIAACVCATLALEAFAPAVFAGTISVANCSEAALRTAFSAATTSGDVVSLTGLSACTITLATSQISIGVANLTINGPSNNSVTIASNHNSRIFNHTGTGTLQLYHMVLSKGKYRGANAHGGCINSAGAVALHYSTLSDCGTYATSGTAQGGGVYAHGALTLAHSTLTGNYSESEYGAYGGGARSASLTANYSTISNNEARFPTGGSPINTSKFEGGAFWVNTGATSIKNSTLDANAATGTTCNGGAVFANGTTYVGASTISNSSAYGTYTSQGGGIFAAGALTLAHSVLSTNRAGGDGGSYGGGLRAGSVIVRYSTLQGNYLSGGPHGFGGFSEGGGMFVYQGSTQVFNSTISDNSAIGVGGGIFGLHSNITIDNSTISGNVASGDGSIISTEGGGIAMSGAPGTAATLHISNSTIAFNEAYTNFGFRYGGAGVRAYGTVVLQSTIISNNLKHGAPSDFSCECGTDAAPTISGSNNLIVNVDPAGNAPPFGVISVTTDPGLVPLGFHGGETKSHALLSGSSAIGKGNNTGSFTNDQRGTGFARVSGGAADIGAYERQPLDDEIFYDGFAPGGG